MDSQFFDAGGRFELPESLLVRVETFIMPPPTEDHKNSETV
jgi:hypothetical protein